MISRNRRAPGRPACEFQRLGGTRVLRTDAWIVAATNRDLQRAITQGQFRKDLYYRHKSKAAKALGLTRQQLYVRMRRYGLE